MRYDKPGYPFEVYPNIHIEHFSDQKQTGPEGCLSIPEIAGDVERSQQVVIRYTDPETLSEVRETVDGYTAVIFQHEIDHLDGILFTDRLTVPAGSGRWREKQLSSAPSGASCRNGRESLEIVPLWKRAE